MIKQQNIAMLSHFTHIWEPKKILTILILHMWKHRLRITSPGTKWSGTDTDSDCLVPRIPCPPWLTMGFCLGGCQRSNLLLRHPTKTRGRSAEYTCSTALIISRGGQLVRFLCHIYLIFKIWRRTNSAVRRKTRLRISEWGFWEEQEDSGVSEKGGKRKPTEWYWKQKADCNHGSEEPRALAFLLKAELPKWWKSIVDRREEIWIKPITMFRASGDELA